MQNTRPNGFSLIELMIVVAIVGIIVTVAYPSYQGFVVSSNRSVAQADLMALASALERHKAANFTYQGAAAGGADTGTPAIFQGHSPAAEPAANKLYDLTIESVSATGSSYRIMAAPVSGKPNADDGKIYYYSDGRKAWDKDGSGGLAASEFCWGC
ncbi:prepilin-type N-terminal cleavage/methylation domain-containing protein [Aestuariibacter halophilus]|uniref:Prepilin-type N-terminal cleavage/methylation domain-containing protein n=1 Tax=Fluctibacter halophilus TaxID=226011 RepID=A0ABS8G2K3_9ALTE|nr:type IV pilin protein [Aestuariibacter halophilus]MCC2614658.1 prepilin-type N-terminal cleavage/methylation domain-containing protein [Aestuariibacter halophilus]